MNELSKKTAVQSAQLHQLFSASYVSLVTSTLLATILAYTQREVIESSVVLLWLFLVVLVAVSRAALIKAYQYSPVDDDATIHVWLVRFRLGVLAVGVVWGSAGFLMFPTNDPQHQMFLIFMLAGLSAGGVVSFSADLVSAVVFSVASLLPIIIRLFIAGDSLSVAMGMAGMLYLSFMVISLHHINRSLTENIVLRLEATAREEKVRISEERYRLLLNHSPVGIFHYDTSLVITYCNEYFTDILHTSIDGILGSNIKSLKDQAILKVSRNALRGVMVHYEGQYRGTFSEASIWIDMACAPSRDETGRIVGGIAIVRDITERKQAEQVLNQLKSMIDISLDGFCIIDLMGNFLQVNQAYSEMVGYSIDEMMNMSISQLEAAEGQEQIQAHIAKIVAQGYDLFETRHRHKKGHIIDVEISAAFLPEYQHFCVFCRDITERKQAEEMLRIGAIAFESQSGMIVTDPNAVILRVNRAFTKLTGYSAQEAVGQTPQLLSSGRHDKGFFEAMWGTLKKTGYWQGEIWNRRKNGMIVAEWLTISAVTAPDGSITHYIGTFSDITENKDAVAEIHRLAYYDPLTHLPNRRLLQDRLGQILAAATRNGLYGAILFLDLDNFKTLNDTRGHDAGDHLLVEVAQRLRANVREGDIVGRLGGDEFVVLLEDLSAEAEVAAIMTKTVGEKLLEALAHPYSFDGYEFHCTASIGIRLYHEQETVEDLLRHADLAMYQAKKAGRNVLCFFDPGMQTIVTAQANMEKELRRALEKNQFKLYFQSQVNLNGQIVGAEVLLRWQHPERGLVSPLDFIPLAEKTNLILPIGQWVLETACTQLKVWEANSHNRHLQFAINVSARQFRHPDFVAKIKQALSSNLINPELLKLELTESLVLDNIKDSIVKMHTLKEIGVRFSLDDFGTGYSSFSYLTQLPLDQLKIDQSFVRNIGVKATDAIIVQTIIGMAHNLGIEVIAEGVETEAQRAFLERHGCPAFQGYLFSKPVPMEEFARLVEPYH
jgi:diguanylate cyclase (GGDEF)-like protein/PAS domain S-box-containing protein